MDFLLDNKRVIAAIILSPIIAPLAIVIFFLSLLAIIPQIFICASLWIVGEEELSSRVGRLPAPFLLMDWISERRHRPMEEEVFMHE